LQTPFVYDSAKGNLLVDVQNFSGGSAILYTAGLTSITDTVSRAYSANPDAITASGEDTGGDVMQIIYTPAPLPPTISSQPTNLLIIVGDTASFSVAAGPQPLSYQWFYNTNTVLDGETNSTLVLTNVQLNRAGTYSVVVANGNGMTLSSNALLTVVPAFITSQPISQTVAMGGTATFAVTAESTEPLSYQWFFNITNMISGATNASLILTNVQADRVGLYSVRVSNTYGVVNSSNASLYLGVIVPNYGAGFQVDNNAHNSLVSVLRLQTVYGASQFPPYPIVITELRWRPDTLVDGPLTDNIPNIQISLSTTATNADDLNSIFAKNSGTNDTMVFSGVATVSTSFTTLSNSTKAFDISLPLQTPFVYESSKGNLLVDVRNFSGGSAILYTAGLTSTTDTVSRAYSDDPNSTTASGADTGAEALQVIYTPAPLPPTISSQPTNLSIIVGDTASFNVAAGPQPLSYQWFYNTNTLLNGETNPTLVLTNVQFYHAGTYSVVVSNTYGTTTSAVAVLTANFPPVNVIIGSTNAMGGNSFTVPVLITANGNENTLSFSMNFNTQRVTYAGIELGSGAPEGLLLPNTFQAISGGLGVAIQLPLGKR